ncbi:MAG: hypothetical protein AAGC68_04480, partial [Verrucomicrobiota bacterium]
VFLIQNASASEAATDCATAVAIFEAGIAAEPDRFMVLFRDSLQTNPGCRRDILISAVKKVRYDSAELEKVIFIAREEFPGDQSTLAEAALVTAPEQSDAIRSAFFAPAGVVQAALAPTAPPEPPGFVELPAEAQKLDADIREAIARVTAKVEGKVWPEQDLAAENFHFPVKDDLRIPSHSRNIDEASLENVNPIDRTDERKIAEGEVVINDSREHSNEIRLDESKFSAGEAGDTRMAREARKKEIAPAGKAGLPLLPKLPRSSVYYIPPAEIDSHSTIDLDRQSRPSLIIRSPSQAPTTPR